MHKDKWTTTKITFAQITYKMEESKVLGGRAWVPNCNDKDTVNSMIGSSQDWVGKLFDRKGQRLVHNYKSSVRKDEGWWWWWLWVDQLAWVWEVQVQDNSGYHENRKEG